MIILDRYDENTAVLEIDGKIREVSCLLIDKSADEGDVLTEIDGIFTVDKAATEERRAAMREKMRRLIRRND